MKTHVAVLTYGCLCHRARTRQCNVTIYDGGTIEDDVFLGSLRVLTNITNPCGWMSCHGNCLRSGDDGHYQRLESSRQYEENSDGQSLCLDHDEDAPLHAGFARDKKLYLDFDR